MITYLTTLILVYYSTTTLFDVWIIFQPLRIFRFKWKTGKALNIKYLGQRFLCRYPVVGTFTLDDIVNTMIWFPTLATYILHKLPDDFLTFLLHRLRLAYMLFMSAKSIFLRHRQSSSLSLMLHSPGKLLDKQNFKGTNVFGFTMFTVTYY